VNGSILNVIFRRYCMPRTPLSASLSFLATLALALVLTSPAFAQKETVLYNFQGTGDGSAPNDGLIADAAGHFYGTTQGQPFGSVFELVHRSSGWIVLTIHTFSGADGSSPQGGLLMDSHGDLYGTTARGGNYDDGVVFKLVHTSTGWSEIVLHNFHYDGVTFFDGRSPLSNLIQDKDGHLFGTTQLGGAGQPCTCGTVFELIPHPGGVWSERILYNFQGSTDGGLPVAGLIFDHAGNLYGTTSNGGNSDDSQCFSDFDTGCGVVFSLSPNGAHGWAETVLYAFTGLSDGAKPTAGLTLDSSGNLYGTTAGDGAFFENSTVFKLTPTSSGWLESTLYLFPNDESNGYSPLGGIVIDATGNLYGTTQFGSAPSSSSPPPPKNIGLGVVFKLAPVPGGAYNESDIHSFSGNPDGAGPGYGKLLLYQGQLYGTTMGGGSANSGTIFRVNR
jgi:uncharacterized repeat protein (TIGR03803 family)